MQFTKLPKEFQKLVRDEESVFSDEVHDMVSNAIDDNQTFDDVKNQIFNGLEYIINEARKAQKLFCK